jgi:predicted house-cleaning NTP pyrophosphatase (Maf/HAM1 superfamily)
VADAPPAPPLLLASTSPQRRAILEQLNIPFEEWEVLFRQKLLVERGLLQAMAGEREQAPVHAVFTPARTVIGR